MTIKSSNVNIWGGVLVVMAVALILSFGYTVRGEQASPDGVKIDKLCYPSAASELPVAELGPPMIAPIGITKVWRTTQPYNPQTKAEAWTDKADVTHWGHNGEDLGGDGQHGATEREIVRSPFAGKVIASLYMKGWGNSVVIASRINEQSDAIMTTHFHHLYERYVGDENCMSTVAPGTVIGLEGATGANYFKHLHFTVRYWANIDHLNEWIGSGTPPGYELFGSGAYHGKDGESFRGSHLPDSKGGGIDYASPYTHYGHIDPEPMFKDEFLDYANMAADDKARWSIEYTKKMRNYGIDLGNWDGTFGIGVMIKRREAARWLRIALGDRFGGIAPNWQIFEDVPWTDPDLPYIQDLAAHPAGWGETRVFDPDRINFNPEQVLNRAEALKTVTLTFYSGEYGDFIKQWQELQGTAGFESFLTQAIGTSQRFMDIDVDEPTHWFASYVYFGVGKGIVALGAPDNLEFRAAEGVNRAEMAKWVVLGYELLHGGVPVGPCGYNSDCPQGQYCSPATGDCVDNSTCIPTIDEPCAQGGGVPMECNDGVCGIDESCESCPEDCGPCGTECGDTICNGDENCETCVQDCGECPVDCPNDICGVGESCENCPQDCGACPCDCNSGSCCDGCDFRPANFVCLADADYEFGCLGNSCGGDVSVRYRDQLCSGVSNSCTGGFTPWGPEQVADACTNEETCLMGDSTCNPDQMCMSCMDSFAVAQYQCNNFSFADNGGGGGGEIFEVCASIDSQTGVVTIKAQKGDNSNFGNRPYQVRVSDPGDDPCGPNTYFFEPSDTNPQGVGSSQLTFTFQSLWGNESSKAYCVTASTVPNDPGYDGSNEQASWWHSRKATVTKECL